MVTSEVTAQAFYPGYLAYLREHGWAVSLVASSKGRLLDLASREGIVAYDLPMRRDPAPVRDVVSLVRAIRLLTKLRPEVVVASTPKAGLLGMIAARVTGVPVRVYQVWGLRLETERGMQRAMLTFLERVAARLATQVVANSPSLATALADAGIARDATVVGAGSVSGIDLERFDPANPDIPEIDSETRAALDAEGAGFRVGYVGRIHRDKGVEVLLAAAESCAASGLPVTLIIVGPPEDRAMEKRLRDSDAAGVRVIRVGSVADPRPYFLAMDVHCLPTRREGMPTVVLEASALGVATITTDATGARDSVIDGVTGLVVPVDDVDALADAIRALAANPTLRASLGSGARAHVIEHFDRPRVFALQAANLEAQRADRQLS